MTLLDFQLITIITVTKQVTVLNWFSWNSHGWCESTHEWTLLFLFFFLFIFFTIGPIEPLIWRKCGLKLVFWLSFSRYRGFWRKKFQSHIWYLISHRRSNIHFCRPTPYSLKNGHAPQKLFFAVILENVFFEKIVKWKIFKASFLTKNLYWFLLPETLYPSKWSCPPTNGFLQFFKHKLKNIREVFLLESMLIRKKILQRKKFVLIKFLPNALLIEKLQNECKSPSLHYKVTCIRSDHAGTIAKFHIYGFIL